MSDHYTLGIYAGVHGVSATLLKNGECIVSIQLERILGIKRAWLIGTLNREFAADRVKQDHQPDLLEFEDHFPRLIEYVETTSGVSLSRMDTIALESHHLFNNPFDHFERDPENKLDEYFKDFEVVHVGHHEAHQSQAWYGSPFDRAAILTLDGRAWNPDQRLGHPIATTASIGRGTSIEPFFESTYSLCGPYYNVSLRLFEQRFTEGKTMGLAPYGKEVCSGEQYRSWTNQTVLMGEPSESAKCWNPRAIPELEARIRHDLETFPSGPALKKHEPPSEAHQAFAYLCQTYFEDVVIHYANAIWQTTKESNLCIAGGGGLNSVCNQLILDKTPFRNIYIYPNCGDEGLSFGLASWAYYNQVKPTRPRRHQLQNDYHGRVYGEAEISAALEHVADLVNATRYGDGISAATAAKLAEGKIIGWFQGASEFGPRALGHRSILAHPGLPDIKDHLNERVKHREMWRPFAPSVLEEHAQAYFEIDGSSPYMLRVVKVREEKQAELPAITHVDGTARVQTVNRDTNPELYQLISVFHEITQIPMLLNTSFNLAGKPIVETPEHALECFLQTDFDNLVLDDYLIEKRNGSEPARLLEFTD